MSVIVDSLRSVSPLESHQSEILRKYEQSQMSEKGKTPEM
jgi:hypothetical protein